MCCLVCRGHPSPLLAGVEVTAVVVAEVGTAAAIARSVGRPEVADVVAASEAAREDVVSDGRIGRAERLSA